MPRLYLLIAIIAEVIGTSALKASDGFSRLLPSAVVVVGYAVAFYGLALAVRSIPIGVVYALWSGAGIVLIALIGAVVYRETLDLAALCGIALILAGVLVLNLLSGTVSR